MIMKMLIAFIAVVFVSAFCTFPAYASNGFFEDYDDTKYSPVNNTVVSVKNILHGAQDYHNGNITADEFVNNVLVTAKDGADANLTGLINTAVDSYNTAGTITRDCLNGLINGINGVITNNGGNVSDFPLNGDIFCRYNIPGYGYIDFFQSLSDNQFYYTLSYSVYDNSGTQVYSGFCASSYTSSLPAFSPLSFISYNRTNYPNSSNAVFSTSLYLSNGQLSSCDFSVFLPGYIYDDPSSGSFASGTSDVGVLSDNDFYRYIDNLVDNLDNLYPDLSTVEGLLQSIINNLNNLDTGGCNCSDLLAELNAAIISLATDNNSDNAQIITLLQSIKDTVKDGGTTDLSPMLKKLDRIIDTLDYLKLINTIDLISDGWDNLTDTEKSYLDEYSTLIVAIGNKFGFTPLNNLIDYFNRSFLFTPIPPNDLTFTYQGVQYVILSSSFFGDLQTPINTARTFASVLIITAWAYSMRKKIVGGI